MKTHYFLILGVLGISVFLVSCLPTVSGEKSPRAERAVLDLRNWDFEKDGIVALEGEWEFYWKKLFKPSDFQRQSLGPTKELILVPGNWSKNLTNGKELPAQGYATYRLAIRLPKNSQNLSLTLPNFNHKVWIDNELVSSSGNVGKSLKTEKVVIDSKVKSFSASQKIVHIVVQKSNFLLPSGDLKSLKLGTEAQIQRNHQFLIAWDMFFVGAFFIMGLYHLILFGFRVQDRSPLFLGGFCFVSISLFLNTNTFLLQQWFQLGWEQWSLIVPTFNDWGGLLFLLFVNSLYSKEMPQIPFRILAAVLAFFPLVRFFAGPELFFQFLIMPLNLLVMLVLGTSLYAIVRAILKKRDGARIFLAGASLLAVSAIWNLTYLSMPHQGQFNPINLGLLAFIFFQSILLAKNFSRAFAMVEDQKARLITIDKLKDNFLANTSHELKTPLNGIIGIADSMVDGATGELSPKTKDNLTMIIQSGKRLSTLVNDILDYSKLKERELQLQLKPVEVKSVADVVLAISQTVKGEKPLELRNQISNVLPLVQADENRLQQILLNLLGNAIKFTHHGSVTLTAKEEGAHIRISVVDTGIGIPKEKQAMIFQSFEQADSATIREYGGTGLGLSISKQLVELQGGEIEVSSTEPVDNQVGGSTFSFTLPIANVKDKPSNPHEKNGNKINGKSFPVAEDKREHETPQNETIEIKPRSYKSEQRTILVVDDEPVNVQVLKNQLTLRHYRVLEAYDGFEALEVLKEEAAEGQLPDLMILDLMMPRMSGYEVAQKVRSTYDSTMPILMLTAKNQVSDLIEGFDSGGTDYMTKPFSKEELFSRVNNHLRLSYTTQSYERFVPREFLRQLQKESIVDVNLGDCAHKEMSIMFSDIRNFTTLSESMTPQENFDFLNTILSRMGPIIREHHGFIDKYIGDAVMALFDQPPDDAIQAAIAMHESLHEFNDTRYREGKIPVRIGIGINTGELMLGCIGEHGRMEGTVISDAVNMASRMEGLTKIYRVSILISDDTFRCLNHPELYDCRILDKVAVKGKKKSVTVLEVYNGDPPNIRTAKNLMAGLFDNALSAYYAKHFEDAFDLFSMYLSSLPDDQVSKIYLERCTHYLQVGVDDDWDGVEHLTTK